jgi:hypothetical protein
MMARRLAKFSIPKSLEQQAAFMLTESRRLRFIAAARTWRGAKVPCEALECGDTANKSRRFGFSLRLTARSVGIAACCPKLGQ